MYTIKKKKKIQKIFTINKLKKNNKKWYFDKKK